MELLAWFCDWDWEEDWRNSKSPTTLRMKVYFLLLGIWTDTSIPIKIHYALLYVILPVPWQYLLRNPHSNLWDHPVGDPKIPRQGGPGTGWDGVSWQEIHTQEKFNIFTFGFRNIWVTKINMPPISNLQDQKAKVFARVSKYRRFRPCSKVATVK